MSLSAAEQSAFDAFNQGIKMKQKQYIDDFDDDILIFDDPVGKIKQQEVEKNDDEIFNFDDITDIHNKQQQQIKPQDPITSQTKYSTVHQADFENYFSNETNDISSTAPQSSQPLSSKKLPQITKDSGYYPVQPKKKQAPKKLTKQDFRPSQPTNSKVVGLLNDDQDVGEVGEWVEKTANEKNNDDDDFDVFDKQDDQINRVQAKNKTDSEIINVDFIEEQRKKINQKLQQNGTALAKRKGPIVNNLREKAKIIALSNTGNQKVSLQSIHKQHNQENNTLHTFSDNEGNVSHDEQHEVDDIDKSPDKKIFQLPQNSIELRLSSSRNFKEEENEVKQFPLEMDEWEAVNKDCLREQAIKPANEVIKTIIYIDAWDQLKQDQNLKSSIKLQRQNSSQGGFMNKLFGCFATHIKSNKLEDEINQILHLSQTAYDDSSKLHFQIIYTIYCQFINTDFCQRYGTHWERIGFQGRDPATDLRSTGVFGLLQILAFIGNYKEYIEDCLEYAKNPNSQLPLCVSLINISLFCIQGLKEKKFHSMINKEDSALSVINKIYFSAFFFFYQKFKGLGGGFENIGLALNQVKLQILLNPGKLVHEFNKAIALYYKNREDCG